MTDWVRVTNAESSQEREKWLIVQRQDIQYFCKPQKEGSCDIHDKEFCYDCYKYATANEAVCTILAKHIGLASLEYKWIDYSGLQYFAIEYLGVNAKLRDYLRREGNANSQKLIFINGVEVAAQSACFDLFVNNTDRTCGNFVYRRFSENEAKLYSIDYDDALLGKDIKCKEMKKRIAALENGKIYKQKCKKLLEVFNSPELKDIIDSTVDSIKNIPNEVIKNAVNEVPKDWWIDETIPKQLVNALINRRDSFNQHFNIKAKCNPCITDNYQKTCEEYKFPEMFQGEQYNLSATIDTKDQSMITSKEDKFEAIKLSYDSLWKEIMFRREKEHRSTRDILIFFGALAVFINNYESIIPINFFIGLIVLIIVIGYCGIFFIYENAMRHNKAAQVIAKINRILGFHDNNMYVLDGRLFPDKWRNWGKEKNLFNTINRGWAWLYHIIFLLIGGLLLIGFATMKYISKLP
ncbi:MAG: hypothetical protein HZA77_09950 [Candidatus Schekmanbacteria bacterium]|nr:hypothetical protein [Candidatus Schekmanbacteria bacterium]